MGVIGVNSAKYHPPILLLNGVVCRAEWLGRYYTESSINNLQQVRISAISDPNELMDAMVTALHDKRTVRWLGNDGFAWFTRRHAEKPGLMPEAEIHALLEEP